MSRRLRLGAAALAVAAFGPAVARAGEAPRLHVFAASSLADALRRIDAQPAYSFGGSNQLAFQLRRGAAADVFASASPRFTQTLFRAGLVERPRALVTNRLVLVVPRANPRRIRTVYDLRRRGVKLVIGGAEVPVGAYTREALRRLRLLSVLRNVVSEEADVKGVVGKVALARADAGFVYATDARAAAGRLRSIALPARARTTVRYEIAVVAGSSRTTAARAWVQRVAEGARARRVFRRAGFGSP